MPPRLTPTTDARGHEATAPSGAKASVVAARRSRARTPSAPGDWEIVNATSATPGFAWEVRPDGAGRNAVLAAYIDQRTTNLDVLELR